MDTPLVTRHLAITGRVQRVGFRNYMVYKARQFNISGWVRNRADGSVEAMVQGTAENVEAIIVRAHRGPPRSEVNSVVVSEGSGCYTGFEQRDTE